MVLSVAALETVGHRHAREAAAAPSRRRIRGPELTGRRRCLRRSGAGQARAFPSPSRSSRARIASWAPGRSPLRMSQTRTPSPSVQPMFFDGIWKVRDVSAGVVVVIVGTGSTVTVSTTVLSRSDHGHRLRASAAARGQREHEPKEKNEPPHARQPSTSRSASRDGGGATPFSPPSAGVRPSSARAPVAPAGA